MTRVAAVVGVGATGLALLAPVAQAAPGEQVGPQSPLRVATTLVADPVLLLNDDDNLTLLGRVDSPRPACRVAREVTALQQPGVPINRAFSSEDGAWRVSWFAFDYPPFDEMIAKVAPRTVERPGRDLRCSRDRIVFPVEVSDGSSD